MKSGLSKKDNIVEFSIYISLVAICLTTLLVFPLDLKVPFSLIGLCIFVIFSYSAVVFFKDIDYLFSFILLSIVLYNFTNLPLHPQLNEIIYPLLSLVFLIIILGWLFKGRIYQSDINFKKYSSTDKFILLVFFVLFFISIVYYNFQDLSSVKGFFKILTILLSFYFFYNFIPNRFLNDVNSLIFFLKSLAILGILTAFLGIITVFIEIFPTEYKGTAISFFQHPNATASIYNFSVPALLFLVIKQKHRISGIERNFFIAGIALNILGLLFTLSRATILSIVLVFLIFMFNHSKKALIFILIITPIAFLFSISDFLTSKGTITVIGRLGLVATTIEMINSSKTGALWGFGTISTIPIFNSFKVALGVFDQNNVPHNVFVFFILQFGLIPFIPLFIYIFKLFSASIFNFFRKKSNDYLTLGISVCVPMLFKNMFEDLVFFPEFILFYLFLIFLGMMNIANRNNIFTSDGEVK